MKSKLKLVVATRNKDKLREIKEILKGLDLEISSLLDYPVSPRIVENGKTFKENAAKKAMAVSRFTKALTMGEDSGLCVEALHGRPGVYSSRFAGNSKDDAKNNRKLLKLLSDLPAGKRKAYYFCAVALADKDGLVKITEGRCSGRIGLEMKGHSGFGYDPLFVIPGYKKTFAELGEKIKHKMSHRYRALEKARGIIQKYIEKHRCA